MSYTTLTGKSVVAKPLCPLLSQNLFFDCKQIFDVDRYGNCSMACCFSTNALRSRPLDEGEMNNREVKRLKQKIGDLVMEIAILKEAQCGLRLPRLRPVALCPLLGCFSGTSAVTT
jgi:hypothetical protein